jgi:hypothetical protein
MRTMPPSGDLPVRAAESRTPPSANLAASNPVFEVDDDWFGVSATPSPAGRLQFAEGPSAPGTPAVAPAHLNPVFEVDEGWFAEHDRTQDTRRDELQRLAREMGIHDVDLPPGAPAAGVPTGASDSDDRGVADFLTATSTQIPGPPAFGVAPIPPAEVVPTAGDVKAGFNGLHAVHQAERGEESAAPAPIAQELLDQLAADVVERLQAGVLRDQWRDVMAAVAELKISDERIDQIAARVADRLQLDALQDRLRDLTAAVAGQITDETLERIATRLANRLPVATVEKPKRKVKSTASTVPVTEDPAGAEAGAGALRRPRKRAVRPRPRVRR